jgi:hypothetical protein
VPWFLRLFSAFRELESQLQHAARSEQQLREVHNAEIQAENSAKIKAQDRVRYLEAENERILTELAEARGKTVHSTELVADFLAQMQFGHKIYSGAPTLPEYSQAPEIIERPRSQARLEVEAETRAFYAQYAGGMEGNNPSGKSQ